MYPLTLSLVVVFKSNTALCMLSVLAIVRCLDFSILDCHSLSKFIYCSLYGFLENEFYGFLDCVLFHLLSSVLVLQVLRARLGLIRPTAVAGPFCLKSDEEDSRKIDPRDSNAESPLRKINMSVFAEKQISLCLCPDNTDRRNHQHLIQQSTEKERRGGRSQLTPRSRRLWLSANCLTTFLSSPKLTHVRPWPETAPPWATLTQAQGGASLFELTGATVPWASGKLRAYSSAIEKFYFRGEGS